MVCVVKGEEREPVRMRGFDRRVSMRRNKEEKKGCTNNKKKGPETAATEPKSSNKDERIKWRKISSFLPFFFVFFSTERAGEGRPTHKTR